MYQDHKKGLNKDLANQARIELYKREIKAKTAPAIQAEFRDVSELSPHFDENGEVIRNFENEAKIYAQDEVDNLLPQITIEDYATVNKYATFVKNQEKNGFKPIVDKVKVMGVPVKKVAKIKPKSVKNHIFDLIHSFKITKFTFQQK